MNRLCLNLLCLIAAALTTGCGGGAATLWVDNDSGDSLQIEIDGKRELVLGGKDYGKCFVSYGEHHVKVTNHKSKVILDETKTFEPHSDGPSWRHYLLDPAGDTKYKVQQFYYYHDDEEAKKGRRSSRVNGLAKRKWIDVPKGAAALVAMPVVFVSAEQDVAKRLCVVPDKG